MLTEKDIWAQYKAFHAARQAGDAQWMGKLDAWLDATPEAFPVIYGCEAPAPLTPAPKPQPSPSKGTFGSSPGPRRADLLAAEVQRQTAALGIADEARALEALKVGDLDPATAAGRSAIRAQLVAYALANPGETIGRPALSANEVTAAVRQAIDTRDTTALGRLRQTFPAECEVADEAIAAQGRADVEAREQANRDRSVLAQQAQAAHQAAVAADKLAVRLAADATLAAGGQYHGPRLTAEEVAQEAVAARYKAETLKLEAQGLAQKLDVSLAELTGTTPPPQ